MWASAYYRSAMKNALWTAASVFAGLLAASFLVAIIGGGDVATLIGDVALMAVLAVISWWCWGKRVKSPRPAGVRESRPWER